MSRALRDRLIGFAVLLLAAAAFLPMLLDGDGVRPDVALDSLPRFERVAIEPLNAESPEWSFEANAERLRAGLTTRKVRIGQLRLAPVETGTPASDIDAAQALGPYAVQVGAFRSPARAVAERDRLAADGFHAFLSEVDGDAGGVTRVVVGPNITRAEAEAAARQLTERYAVSAFVVRLAP